MTNETPLEDIRQRLEERKRLNLTEGRNLLTRLEESAAEIARLREQIEQSDTATPAASAEPAPHTNNNIPTSLRDLMEQTATRDEVRDPNSLAGAVYAWCNQWLQIRPTLVQLHATELQVREAVENLEREAETIRQRLAELVAQRQG